MNFGTTNIHCINLDRRPDRWAQFQREAAKGRFVAQRKSAVDGKRLSESELFALQKEFAPQHKEMLRIDDWCGGDHKCILACYLSHVQLLRDFVNRREHNLIVIFEDDTRISHNLVNQRIWNEVYQRDLMGRSWDLLTLDVDPDKSIANPKKLWRPGMPARLHQFPRSRLFYRSHAYIATQEGARKILATALREPHPFDHHLHGDKHGGISRNLIILPTPVSSQKEDSDIR